MKIQTLLSGTIVATFFLSGISHAVPIVAGGNGNFEATTIGNFTSYGSGLYDGGLSALDGWTFSGGVNNTFRWIFDSNCPFGPVLGSYSLNLTQASSFYANVATTTVTGLTAGQGYSLSFETAARSGASGTVTVKVDSTSVGTFDQTVGTTFVTRSFSFTASDTSASVSFEYGSTVNNSGYMLDNVAVIEEPWTPANGIWSGGSGDWNTAANWQANTIAQGIDRSATFNGITPVTATVDINRPIGALLFSGANHTIAAGTGSLTLDGDTTYTTPTVTVASGLTATINATLNGNEGLLKNGSGTLVLPGNISYSGGTTVGVGTMKLDLALKSSNPPLGSFAVESGATLNLDNTNTTVGSYYPQSFVLSGEGTLTKTNIGSIDFWNGSDLTGFTGTVDVQEGSLRVNNIGAAANMGQATLNIALGATFDVRYNASLSVDKLTGSGTLDQTFNGGSGLSVTVGSNDGSSTFDGVIQNGSGQPLALIKSGTGTFTLAGLNTYTGDTTVEDGTLVLADNAQLRFIVTDTPAANMVTGTGTATFHGDFNIDTTGVAGTTGGIWLLVDLTNLTGESFSSTFSVIGFSDPEDDGIWTMTDAKGDWSFSEASGELTLDVGSDYDDWGTTYGLTAGSEGGDLDSDGLTNFEEYAFGLIPNSGSSVNPIVAQLNKATGTFSYTRRLQSKTDLIYTVRSSTTLETNGWTNLVKDTDYTEAVSAAGDLETVTITLTTPPTAAKLFIQVKAEP